MDALRWSFKSIFSGSIFAQSLRSCAYWSADGLAAGCLHGKDGTVGPELTPGIVDRVECMECLGLSGHGVPFNVASGRRKRD